MFHVRLMDGSPVKEKNFQCEHYEVEYNEAYTKLEFCKIPGAFGAEQSDPGYMLVVLLDENPKEEAFIMDEKGDTIHAYRCPSEAARIAAEKKAKKAKGG